MLCAVARASPLLDLFRHKFYQKVVWRVVVFTLLIVIALFCCLGRQVGDLAYQVLCSRVYTDSTLCLEEDPLMCLCAAVQFALLVRLGSPSGGMKARPVKPWGRFSFLPSETSLCAGTSVRLFRPVWIGDRTLCDLGHHPGSRAREKVRS